MPSTERGVDLGVVAQRGSERGRRQGRPLAATGLAHHDPGQQLGDGVGTVRSDGEVDDHQVGGELRAGGDQGPVGAHDEGVAVEDQFVLPAHLVDVRDGAPGLGHPALQHLEALGPPATVVGRRVEVDDDVRPGAAGMGHGSVVEPDVLADGHADPGPGDAEEGGRLVAGDEPALLVEHAVVGQEALAVHARDPAAGADRRRVGQALAPGGGADEPDHHRALPRGGRDLLERGHVVGHEPGFEEEVLGRVPGDGELRHRRRCRRQPPRRPPARPGSVPRCRRGRPRRC